MILPLQCRIPSSYNKIKNFLYSNKVNCQKICQICKQKIMSENTKNKKSTMLCLNENCIRNGVKLKTNQIIKIYNNELKYQLRIILDNHYSKLISYQGININFYFLN